MDQVSVSRLEECVQRGIISPGQLRAILDTGVPAPEASDEARKGFHWVTVAYYFGALTIISAFAWFLVDQWNSLGHRGIFVVASAYMVFFWVTGWYLRRREKFPVAGGLLITVAVGMTPLAVYSLEAMTGLWPVINPGKGFRYHDYYPWINGRWIVMELATVAMALVALRRVHFPFLVAPIAFSLWFFSMDIAELILRRGIDWEGRAWVSIGVGAVILAAAHVTDRMDRRREDFAFWLYLFGLMAFWGGLSSLPGRTEWSRFLYFLINLGLVAISLYLRRRVFLVFGALGCYGYIGHLAYSVFRNSVAFPFALSGVGLFLILITVWMQRTYPRLAGLVPAAAVARADRRIWG